MSTPEAGIDTLFPRMGGEDNGHPTQIGKLKKLDQQLAESTITEPGPTDEEMAATAEPSPALEAARTTATYAAATRPSAEVQELLERVLVPKPTRLRRVSSIAEGGMGHIEVVADSSLKRRLAMKVIHDRLQGDIRTVGMFVREAQITGQLDHPNIVPVHDLGLDEAGHLFFTMKLVEGCTLATLIRELPPAPLDHGALLNLLDVLVKVCDALALAHSRGVIHCDIKPENVMVGEFGEVYLMDWGLARIIDSTRADASVGELNEQGSYLGTPAYMSPEQANGNFDELDERTDVFGLGSILYEIITRHPPYRAVGCWQAVAAAQACDYAPLAEPGADLPVPRGLIRIVERAMSARREDRFASAGALKSELMSFMRGGGQFPIAKVARGDHVVREGEPGEAAYIIASGRCEVYKTVEGRKTTLRTMVRGDVFGETAILSPGPRTASVVATEETTLRVVTREVLEAEVDSMKPWMGAFIRALATRFREREDSHPGAALLAQPALLAEQALMRLTTWGEETADGRLQSSWTKVRDSLSALFGDRPEQIELALAEFPEFEIVGESDRIRVRDPNTLKATLRARLEAWFRR